MTSFRVSLIFSFVERYGNFIIFMFSSIILARLLSPAETGIYSVAAGLINVAQSLRESGVSTYILQEEQLSREKIASATGVCLLIASVLTLAFFLGSSAIARFYDNSQLTLIIRVLCMNFIVVAFASIGSAQLRRHMMFRANMFISLAANGVNAVISTGLAALHTGAISLAWGSLAGVTMTVVGNCLALGSGCLIWPSLRRWRELAHFGVPSSASGLLSALADRTPDLVVGRLVGLEGAGLFSRGNGLITLFRTAFTGAIDPVIGSSLAMMHRDKQDVRESLLRIFSYLSAIGWPALCVLGLLARPIIVIVFGAKWVGSVGVAQILCVGSALSLIGNVSQTYLVSTGAVRSIFVIQAISVPVFVCGVALGCLISLEGAAFGAAATGGLITVLSLEMLWRRIGLEWTAIGRSVFPSMAITMLTGLPPAVVALKIGSTGDNLLGWTLAAGGGAAIAWAGGIYLFRHPLREELALGVSWLRRKFERIED